MDNKTLKKLINGQLNNLKNVQETTNIILCDEKCRKSKKGLELYKEYIKAKNDNKGNPEKFEEARRNYMTFDKGGAYYRNFLEKEAKGEIKKYAKKLETDFNNEVKTLKILLNKYDSQKIYENNIDDLVNNYDSQLENLKKEYDTINSKTNINHRLKDYEDDQTSFYDSIIYYLKIIYYIIFSLLIIFKVILEKKYSNKKLISIYIILLLLPMFI